jgi:hypothetical protein
MTYIRPLWTNEIDDSDIGVLRKQERRCLDISWRCVSVYYLNTNILMLKFIE